MGKLLIDEIPLTVLPSLVKLVGLERALILQQVHYACQQPKSGVVLEDGHKYVWNTYEDWRDDYFPFWSTRNIQKHILKLEKENILISQQASLSKGDAKKYYRVNEELLNYLVRIEADVNPDNDEDMVPDSAPSPSSTQVDDHDTLKGTIPIYSSAPSLKGKTKTSTKTSTNTLSKMDKIPIFDSSENNIYVDYYPTLHQRLMDLASKMNDGVIVNGKHTGKVAKQLTKLVDEDKLQEGDIYECTAWFFENNYHLPRKGFPGYKRNLQSIMDLIWNFRAARNKGLLELVPQKWESGAERKTRVYRERDYEQITKDAARLSEQIKQGIAETKRT